MADTNKTPSTYARRTPSTDNLRAWIAEAEARKSRALPKGSAAVLIPILIRDGKYHVLYEVRSAKLKTQPGEVCFPGGRIEQGETPGEAAIREACEELCITRDQIEIVGALDTTIGPGGIPFYAFIGTLKDYQDQLDEIISNYQTKYSDTLQVYQFKTRDYNFVTEQNCPYTSSDNLHMNRYTYTQIGNALAAYLKKNCF